MQTNRLTTSVILGLLCLFLAAHGSSDEQQDACQGQQDCCDSRTKLFPTGNAAQRMTGKQLNDLLDDNGKSSNSTTILAVLVHLPGDPHSE